VNWWRAIWRAAAEGVFMIRRIGLVVAAAVVAASVSAQQEEKFGAGVTLQTATPIAALYENPQKFVGQTIRVDGVVTSVCAEMGCWMALGTDATSEQSVRFKVDHGAGITFPVKAKGRKASAEGVFERIAATDKEANEAAHEHVSTLKKAPEFAKTYQIKVTGAVIR
jgi:hypothetical protein